MKFDDHLLDEYKTVLATTRVQQGYQQILQVLKYVSSSLQQQMTNHDFSKRIVENQMQFSYFQLTDPALKKRGLKVQIIFIHKSCVFEVWLSGYNRKIQRDYYSKISSLKHPFSICKDPESSDYIMKKTLQTDLLNGSIDEIILEIKTSIIELEEYFLTLSPSSK